VALLLLLIVALGIGIARAATLGLIVATGLVWLAGERRFFAYPVIGAVVAAILALLVFASGSSINKVAAVASFQEKMVSMVDFSGTYKYQTDLGAMKADNNEFRRAFWKIMVDETTTKNPLLGMGFGYNFLPRFEAYYNRGGWEGLRSPHNIFITMYGRLGAVGVLLFGLLAGLIFRDAIRAAIQVRQGRLARLDLAYWCGTVVFLVSGTFGVVLEGPMGGIPFWTFLGLAASSAALPPTAKTPVSAPRPAYAERRVRVRRENVPVLAARPGRA
jgi:O-antigen ligase